ncbi:DUF4917 family protein [Pseudomonas sp. RIT-PI-S]|uniref:DUF4917 family protein n=1 Tax=Pseudomonas sp. RIT-PI-S TaxID=3035295 RepID=UPI0021D99367|nr:DUF4917 family protein [Pseudomonas sp. RIT-PI-S]
MDRHDLNASLPAWNDTRLAGHCPGLLLGNGASRALWRGFAYDALFELAQKVRNRPLGQTDLALFKALGSESFEQVLSALNTTTRVNAALAIGASGPLNRYYAIKEALIHAMRSVHLPWRLLPAATRLALNTALREYRCIYSSNYDLLCHWAVWEAPEGFDDRLDVDTGFDPRQPATGDHQLFYLHGGLHLLKDRDGATRRRAAAGSELLDGFAINTPGDVPLFVNEGRSADKLRGIRGSDYLASCLAALASHRGPLCLFGHQLGAQDAHLLAALRQAPIGQMAVAIFPLSAPWILSQKQHYQALLGDRMQLEFFDATSHPLGAPSLHIPREKPKAAR